MGIVSQLPLPKQRHLKAQFLFCVFLALVCFSLGVSSTFLEALNLFDDSRHLINHPHTLYSQDSPVPSEIFVDPYTTSADEMSVSLKFSALTLFAGDKTSMTFTLKNFVGTGVDFDFYMPRTFSFKWSICKDSAGKQLVSSINFPIFRVRLGDLGGLSTYSFTCSDVHVGESETFGAYSYFVYLSYIYVTDRNEKIFTGAVPFRVWPIDSRKKKFASVRFTPFVPGSVTTMTISPPETKFDAQAIDVFRCGSKYLTQFMPSEEVLNESCLFQYADPETQAIHTSTGRVSMDREAGTLDFYFNEMLSHKITNKLIRCNNIALEEYKGVPYYVSDSESLENIMTFDNHSGIEYNFPPMAPRYELTGEADWDYNLHPWYREKQFIQARRVHPSLGEYWVEIYDLTIPLYPPSKASNSQVRDFTTFSVLSATAVDHPEGKPIIYDATGVFTFTLTDTAITPGDELYLGFLGVRFNDAKTDPEHPGTAVVTGIAIDGVLLPETAFASEFQPTPHRIVISTLPGFVSVPGVTVELYISMTRAKIGNSGYVNPFVQLRSKNFRATPSLTPFPINFGIGQTELIRLDVTHAPIFTSTYVPHSREELLALGETFRGFLATVEGDTVCDSFIQSSSDVSIQKYSSPQVNETEKVGVELISTPVTTVRCHSPSRTSRIPRALVQLLGEAAEVLSVAVSEQLKTGVTVTPKAVSAPQSCFAEKNPECSERCFRQCDALASCTTDEDCMSLSCTVNPKYQRHQTGVSNSPLMCAAPLPSSA